MAKEFIVAIELGSSKITGIAGKKNMDGSTSILAVAQEDSTACIRKGVVYNIDKTVVCLNNIVKKLETSLKTNIAKVYVGVGGQSIRSIQNVAAKDLPAETIVTQDIVNELMDTNRNMPYTDHKILDAITLGYKVDKQFQLDPAGIQCSRLEGNYLNILWHETFYRNLNKCFNTANISIADMYLSPLALADSVLTENEKRSGCVLVDLGADTTTVAVYYKNILRHLSVIPLGGNNITKDIASLQMDEQEAELLKLKYARAFTDNSDIDSSLMLPVNDEQTVASHVFINIVEARLREIIENAWFQVPREFAEKLLGGIILTGGGSNMPGIERPFRNHTHIEKIRIAKFVNQTINSTHPEITAHNGKMNTILGLLDKADMNCAGNEFPDNLFPENNLANTPSTHTDQPQTNHTTSGTTGKVIVQDEEKKRREEKEELERKEREEKERLRKEQKENSGLRKFWKSIKEFGGKIVSEEE